MGHNGRLWQVCSTYLNTKIKREVTRKEKVDEKRKCCIFTRGSHAERGKRDVDCDKQVEKAVTVPNCVLKGSWGEGGNGGIRKKLKSEYAAYLESKFRRNDGNSI